jgi:hypothetical protein
MPSLPSLSCSFTSSVTTRQRVEYGRLTIVRVGSLHLSRSQIIFKSVIIGSVVVGDEDEDDEDDEDDDVAHNLTADDALLGGEK